MKIKDMFAKKIDREIQGVIIVGKGEDANVSTRPIKKGLWEQRQRWACGFPASLEAVNRTS